MKPTTIAITSIAGTLGVVAAIGFAQPDGIDPPAGPVTDTQPSLSSINENLNSLLENNGAFPPNLQVASTGSFANSTVTLLNEVSNDVRIFAFNVQGSEAIFRDSTNNFIAFGHGGSWSDSSSRHLGSSQYLLGGLQVSTPLSFTNTSPNPVNAFVYYWIEE